MAQEWAKLSHCKRKQVGALIVKDKMIISDRYNGCPSVSKTPAKMKMVIPNGTSCTPKLMP